MIWDTKPNHQFIRHKKRSFRVRYNEWTGTMGKKHLGYIYCPECQYRGKPELTRTGGQIVLEIILFLLFILPWVIYKLFAKPKLQCPKCGNRNVKHLPGGETSNCPFCGARVPGFETNCPQCGRKLTAGEKYQKARTNYHKQMRWKDRD